MRRLDPNTKEIICWVRSSTVQARERLEFFDTNRSAEKGGEEAGLVGDITEALVEGFRESLIKALGIEVMAVVNSFDLPKNYVSKKGSAFPHLSDCKDIDFSESVSSYMSDVIEDILNLPSLPAMTIVDEVEEWLNDLYDYHLNNSKGKE